MAAKKSALGKGLGALLADADDSVDKVGGSAAVKSVESNPDVNLVDINLIEANPFQPRTEFEKEALEELSESIKILGIITPITVRKISDNKYQLISGERRLRASKMAGLERMPAYVRTADDQGMLEMALVENIQREDLDAIEIAISYQRLIDECNLTQENMSDRVGKKRATVANYLRLLKLPAEIQLGIRKRLLSMGHARALVNIDDEYDQLQIFEKIITEGLSVRKVEEMVKELKNPKPEKGENEPKAKSENIYVELQSQLSDYFKTAVDFKRSDKGTGKITIPFKSDEELERLISLFDKFK